MNPGKRKSRREERTLDLGDDAETHRAVVRGASGPLIDEPSESFLDRITAQHQSNWSVLEIKVGMWPAVRVRVPANDRTSLTLAYIHAFCAILLVGAALLTMIKTSSVTGTCVLAGMAVMCMFGAIYFDFAWRHSSDARPPAAVRRDNRLVDGQPRSAERGAPELPQSPAEGDGVSERRPSNSTPS
jgi:hypothetical protein